MLLRYHSDELVKNKTDIDFSAGETIVERGVIISNVLYISKGLVKIEITNDNKLFTMGIIHPQCFIGIICCFAFNKFSSAFGAEPPGGLRTPK